MATRSVSSRSRKSKGGITLNEFADHFAGIISALGKGKVEGIAMAVVVADSPTSSRVGVMSSTLTRDGSVALILRDATRDLWMECEEKVHDWMEAAPRKQAAAGATGGP